MQKRAFNATGQSVSEIGFGTWAIGADWGSVDDADAIAALNAGLDAGISFIDTADVYGDGRAERFIAQVLATREGPRPFVATKAGKRLNPHVTEGYNYENLSSFIDRSREYLEMDSLDLVQLHCPTTDTFYQPETFEALARITEEGRIRAWGVSVEKVEEGMKALEYPGLAGIQVIYNIFRQRPAERLMPLAKEKGVAIIVRVPLASGLLSGKFKRDTTFEASDHRNYNRSGEAFDVGETFAGVPYEVGLDAVEALRPLVPEGATMAQFALRWILMNDAVTTVIPGAKSPKQAQENAAAAALPVLSDDVMREISAIYDARIRPHVHQRW
jgi:aryl-alcohol dehydrogenase-like predicted oxidoreductase